MPTKNAINFVMHVNTTVIFTGMQEGVLPINNPKNFLFSTLDAWEKVE